MNDEILLSVIIPAAAVLLGAILGAVIVLVSVWLGAKQSRISVVHEQMCACLVRTIDLIDEMFTLSKAVSNRLWYRQITDESDLGSAWDRYWDRIDSNSKENKELYSKQLLFLPRKLFNALRRINRLLNEIRHEVRDVKPQKKKVGYVYPDTSDLGIKLDQLQPFLIEFVDAARAYMGVEKLKPFSKWDDAPILSSYEEIIQNNQN